jgi:excisionase family DNA binding protein
MEPRRVALYDPLLSVPTVAQMTGTHVNTVWGWIRRGDLPSVKLGRRIVRVRALALNDFLLARTERRSARAGAS